MKRNQEELVEEDTKVEIRADDGGRSQRETQRRANKMKAHDRIDGGRSQCVVWSLIDIGGAGRGGGPDAGEEMKRLRMTLKNLEAEAEQQ